MFLVNNDYCDTPCPTGFQKNVINLSCDCNKDLIPKNELCTIKDGAECIVTPYGSCIDLNRKCYAILDGND
jgi:hypothetical protein